MASHPKGSKGSPVLLGRLLEGDPVGKKALFQSQKKTEFLENTHFEKHRKKKKKKTHSESRENTSKIQKH